MMFYCGLIIIAISSFSSALFAEIDYSYRNNMRHNGERIDGWEFSTGLEFPFSYSNSQSRLGISDGHYFQIEGRSVNFLHYSRGLHDWSTSLFITESFSMTPTIENRWIKAKDLLQFESRYVYNFATWAGAYAHMRLQSSFFKGTDIHDKEKNYDLRNVDDQTIRTLKATEQALTDPFLPLYLQQNLGVFATLAESPSFTWETRAALAFRQTFADKQKVYVDEKDDVIIIRDLQSFFQIGPAAGTSIGGKFFSEMLSYNAGIDAMWPAWQAPKKDRSFLKAVVLEGGGGIGLKLNNWASLNYEYSVKRIPDILEKFQQEHAIHLTINFDWVYKFNT